MGLESYTSRSILSQGNTTTSRAPTVSALHVWTIGVKARGRWKLRRSPPDDPALDIVEQDVAIPIRSLTDLSAQVIAQNLERYDPQVLTPDYLSFGMAALIIRRLRASTDGHVALGNWARFASQFGALSMKLLEADMSKLETCKPPCQPSPFARPYSPGSDPYRSSTARHRVAQILYKELINSLLANPSSCPLLKLNAQSTELISSLCLSDTMFGDSHALALKELKFLTVLEIERTNITDLGIHQLASALYQPPGTEERRGLYRLAAWSLNGCKGVTDRSTKRLVEWDRLNYLDLRQTACVFPTYLRILNRHLSLYSSSPSPDRWKMSPALGSSSAHPSLLQTILHSTPTRLGPSPHESSYVSLHIQSVNSTADSHRVNRSRRRPALNERKEDDCVLVRTISPTSSPGPSKANGDPAKLSCSTSKKRSHLSTMGMKPNNLDSTLAQKRPRKTMSSNRKIGSILDEILLGVQPDRPALSGGTSVDTDMSKKTSSFC
ncbi:hypothetical protein [Phaffia rhodozyma]|uniref:Uncharacterized protein n=1 Tax=Phaffia rhodozyma TaxID=264483 RepID=A0A0F7SNU1_PHARH|nr:hypothetical protein [Phaffia rhodozyma]